MEPLRGITWCSPGCPVHRHAGVLKWGLGMLEEWSDARDGDGGGDYEVLPRPLLMAARWKDMRILEEKKGQIAKFKRKKLVLIFNYFSFQINTDVFKLRYRLNRFIYTAH